MNVSDAVAARFSARAFLDKPVPKDLVVSILDRAKQAPSGGNLQPWHVHVLMGEAQKKFLSLVADRLKANPMGEGGDYEIYPANLWEPYRTRRFRCGEMLYESIQIPREDKPGRLRQFGNNFRFFGAPVGLIFALDQGHGPAAMVRCRHVYADRHAAGGRGGAGDLPAGILVGHAEDDQGSDRNPRQLHRLLRHGDGISGRRRTPSTNGAPNARRLEEFATFHE